MNAERMLQLQELMKEARQSGELESALAATSVFPVPKRASRATVPVADYNMMKASMPKQGGAGDAEYSDHHSQGTAKDA